MRSRRQQARGSETYCDGEQSVDAGRTRRRRGADDAAAAGAPLRDGVAARTARSRGPRRISTNMADEIPLRGGCSTPSVVRISTRVDFVARRVFSASTTPAGRSCRSFAEMCLTILGPSPTISWSRVCRLVLDGHRQRRARRRRTGQARCRFSGRSSVGRGVSRLGRYQSRRARGRSLLGTVFLRPRPAQDGGQTVVAFVTGELVHLLAGVLERHHQRPRARPHGWIVHGHVVLDRVR